MFAMHGMKHQLKAAMNTSISNGAVFFVSRIGKCSVKPPFQHVSVVVANNKTHTPLLLL